jgi:hypothetical protein
VSAPEDSERSSLRQLPLKRPMHSPIRVEEKRFELPGSRSESPRLCFLALKPPLEASITLFVLRISKRRPRANSRCTIPRFNHSFALKLTWKNQKPLLQPLKPDYAETTLHTFTSSFVPFTLHNSMLRYTSRKAHRVLPFQTPS